MHQSIPAAPSPTSPRPADPRALAFFLPWMAKSRGWGLLSCQIPRGADEKRGKMSSPPSTLQHFSLIAQSSNAILRFFVSINAFFCNSAILIKTSRRDDTSLWFFSIVIKLLTLKLIVRCKVNCYE